MGTINSLRLPSITSTNRCRFEVSRLWPKAVSIVGRDGFRALSRACYTLVAGLCVEYCNLQIGGSFAGSLSQDSSSVADHIARGRPGLLQIMLWAGVRMECSKLSSNSKHVGAGLGLSFCNANGPDMTNVQHLPSSPQSFEPAPLEEHARQHRFPMPRGGSQAKGPWGPQSFEVVSELSGLPAVKPAWDSRALHELREFGIKSNTPSTKSSGETRQLAICLDFRAGSPQQVRMGAWTETKKQTEKEGQHVLALAG